MESLKIGIQLSGLTVASGFIAHLGQLTRVNLHRKSGGHQLNGLPPRLSRMHPQDRSSRLPQKLHHPIPQGAQTGRRWLDPFRQRQALGQRIQLAVKDHQRIGPKAFQGLGRHLRRHPGMAIAVTAYPSPEPQGGHAGTGFECGNRKTRTYPSVAESTV